MKLLHNRRRSPLRHGAWPVLAAAALLGACSSGGDDPAPAPNPPPSNPPPSNPPPNNPPGVPPLDANVVSLDGAPRVGTIHWSDGNTSTGGQGADVNGLRCTAAAPNTMHQHSHLSIFLNGAPLTLPQGIGFVEPTPTTACHYWIHTHDESGLIHLHGPAPTIYTLGQFAAIWGQPLQRDNVAGLTGLPVAVYVTDDGVAREYTGDLADLQLLSHRAIVIQVGTSITSIPQFSWTGE